MLLLASPARAGVDVLRVCADPDLMPYSNVRGEGFENRIVQLAAQELGVRVEYTWRSRRSAEDALKRGACDAAPGVSGTRYGLAVTRPYYRAGYVFVTLKDRGLRLATLDDGALRALKIGVQLSRLGSYDTPVVHALARRGLIDHIVGYPETSDDPAWIGFRSRMIAAVDDGEVDVLVAWGPLAGYEARQARHPLALSPIPSDLSALYPMTADVSFAVREGDEELRDRLDAALAKRAAEIAALLEGFGLPPARAAF